MTAWPGRSTPLALTVVLTAVLLTAGPALAQFTILDQAQDGFAAPAEPAAPPPPCGTQTINIARMGWPSAQLLAEIHARLLAQEYGCEVNITPGDLAATAASMGSTGQPAVAPEMWVTRVAEVWNAGIEAQKLRPAAPTYRERAFERWFIPGYVAQTNSALTSAAGLAEALPGLNDGAKVRFISCPIDWACSLINRNLVRAYGLSAALDVVVPANRFEMDTLIAEAVSRSEPVVFYYWQPNAVLAQFDFVPLDMGPYDAEAAKCLAQQACPTPLPSGFADETVVVALSEWVFTDIPAIASYFQRSSLSLGEMDELLAQLNEPGGTAEGVAARFVAGREDIWRDWVGPAAP